MSTSNHRTRAKHTTKEELFNAALDLFSSRGFTNVGVRDIATIVGIQSASIYNHYESKDEILDKIFKYFHKLNHANNLKNEDLIKNIKQSPPRKIIEQIISPVGGEAEYDTMCKILTIAITERNRDVRARNIISEIHHSSIQKLTQALAFMQALNIIMPLDIEQFVSIYISSCVLPSSLLFGSEYSISYNKLKARRQLLLDLISEKHAQSSS